ncbi:MAG: crotonase, partial [Dehalococcoidia bacterium]|nr:crotonase [Dehalococcoidia bacterium]
STCASPSAEPLLSPPASAPQHASRRNAGAARITQDADLPRGLMAELEADVRLFATADRLEGMTAFLQRRPPRYQGA